MLVRATVNLEGFPAGQVRDVDPDECEGFLNAGYLVPVEPRKMPDKLKPPSRRAAAESDDAKDES